MKLYEYQQAGVERLLLGNCILADEMGLGKTVTALTAAYAGRYPKVTVVCPLAAVSVWEEHVEKVGADWPDFCEITIVPYSRPAQFPVKGSVLIVDEAHYVKNRNAQRSKLIKKLSAGYRTIWLLTGTPYINHASDYWSLLNICYPKMFKSYWRYVDIWCSTVWTPFGRTHKKILPGAKEPEKFAEMLHKFVLRRTKEQVGLELPPVREIVIPIEMTRSQKYQHRDALKNIVLEMASRDWIIPNAAVAYTRARQIAVDPRILGGDRGLKLHALSDMCQEGERVIVFSEFVEALKLAHYDYPGHFYHGGLNEKQRADVLCAWRTDPLMLPLYMSRAAGGIALTLVESCTIVFTDEPWTSTDREQAVARVVRIGQARPVTIYSLRSVGSVEDHVLSLQEGKKSEIAKVHKHLLTTFE